MIRWETSPDFVTDAEVIAAWEKACEEHDEARMDAVSAEMERRNLDC